MKTKLALFSFIYFLTWPLAFSQFYDIVSIDFEKNVTLEFSDSAQNIWQIGSPEKEVFLQSRSGNKAIVTDTINSYPANNRSSFSFTIYKQDYYWYNQLHLEFYHYFEMDTISDSAYVDFSYDGGLNWFIGPEFDLNFEGINHQRYNVETGYGVSDPAPIINGNSDGWARENYYWFWYSSVKKSNEEPIYPDSIMVRFNFVSDSLETNKDGWMIDDIHVGVFAASNREDFLSKEIDIYPNPACSVLKIGHSTPLNQIRIIDIEGKTVLEKFQLVDQSSELDIRSLNPGIYVVVVKLLNDETRYARFVKY